MPSKRVAEAWVKVKPEYIDNLGDSLDVVIVGTSTESYCKCLLTEWNRRLL